MKMFAVSDKTALSLLKWGEFCILFLLALPVIVILYQDKGITLGDFFLIQGLFGLMNLLFQIPSGYMSDIFSRKKVMLVGAILWFCALTWLFFAYGFWQILLAEATMGISTAMFNGTKESYAYDLLKRMKRQDHFLKEYGSITVYGTFSTFLAVLLGGWLYAGMGDWILILSAVVAFLGILCVLFLPELREVHNKLKNANPLKDLANVVKSAVKHPELKWLMLFPAMFGAFTLVMMWILQPTMETAGVPVSLFGIFVGINMFMRILFAKYAHKIQDIFGLKNVIYMCVFAVVLAVAMVFGALLAGAENLWIVYICCAILAIIPASIKLNQLMFNTLMHHKIKSQERATVLSVSAMYGRFFSAGMMMLMKPLLDGWGIEWTMAIVLMMFTMILYPLRKVLSMR